MADNREQTITPGGTGARPAVDPRRPVPPVKSGMSRWIWIAAAVVAALFILTMVFGGGEDMATAPVDDGSVVTQPTAPAIAPADPAPAPAPTSPAPAQN